MRLWMPEGRNKGPNPDGDHFRRTDMQAQAGIDDGVLARVATQAHVPRWMLACASMTGHLGNRFPEIERVPGPRPCPPEARFL